MKKYSRDEKIDYYIWKIYDLKRTLEKAEQRLEYIQSEHYQDWNSDLRKQLDNKKKKKS